MGVTVSYFYCQMCKIRDLCGGCSGLVHTGWSSRGARCSRTILRIQGKKKKIRSLRSDDILVTPNFRENHRGRREGANNAIFRVIVPYFIFSP